MLTVNGQPTECEDSVSLSELLHQLQLSDQSCAVEVNKELVPHQRRNDVQLHDGDTIEIVSLVGGG